MMIFDPLQEHGTRGIYANIHSLDHGVLFRDFLREEGLVL